MVISIKEIFKDEIPSKEFRQRFNNKQIKVNNEPITNFLETVDIELDSRIELGDFIYKNSDRLKIARIVDIKDFFGDFDTNVESLLFLGAYTLISLSKKEHYVFLIDRSVGKYQVDYDDSLEENEIGLPLEIIYYINEKCKK